jgi:hypothetical protein
MGAHFKHTTNKELISKILLQLSGDAADDAELIPPALIKGSGYIWCYEATYKQVLRVKRGIKCYTLDKRKDDLNRIMVYTITSYIILIDENELIFTGFN